METVFHREEFATREQRESILAECWERFLKEFPTEQSCMNELRSRILSNLNFRCSRCNYVEFQVLGNGRILKCMRCNLSKSVTAGTFFQRIRRARPWLAAIWLMEHGVAISSNRLEKLVDIAQSSALNILRKLSAVILADMEDLDFAASYCFFQIFCNRSRETPARSHPSSEQQALDAGGDGANKSGDLDSDSQGRTSDASSKNNDTVHGKVPDPETESANPESAILSALLEAPLSVDEICQRTSLDLPVALVALTVLELDFKIIRHPGNLYARADLLVRKSVHKLRSQHFNKLRKMIELSIDFVRHYFHGVSRKYLQLYLAIHWCIRSRMRWRRGVLIDACARFGPLTYSDIIAYVTPATVSISD